MAKKSRKARSGASARPVQRPQPSSVAQPVRAVRPIRPPVPEAAKEVDFSKEYHYVIEDLKRIAIIAGALLALLVVLAVIIG